MVIPFCAGNRNAVVRSGAVRVDVLVGAADLFQPFSLALEVPRKVDSVCALKIFIREIDVFQVNFLSSEYIFLDWLLSIVGSP